MIKFEDNKAIYEQMADRLCEYAVMLQVNTNTAVKAYELLAREEIIYNRRGLGYFVSPGARKQIMTVRQKVFLTRTLPSLFREMNLLGITMEEIEEEWTKLQRQ